MTTWLDALRAALRVRLLTPTGESVRLHEAPAADAEPANGVTFNAMPFPGVDRNDHLVLHAPARQRSVLMSPALRRGLASGRTELLGVDTGGPATPAARKAALPLGSRPPEPTRCAGLVQPRLGE